MCYLGLLLSIHRLRRIDFKPLEDKIAGKLGAEKLENVTMASQRVFVHFVLTSQAIIHITSLEIPKEVFLKYHGSSCFFMGWM
jgi:hypothetical protein